MLPSPFFNKLEYQQTIMIAAIAVMLRLKGTSTSDADFGALVAALGTIRTEADFEASLINVNFATSMVFDAAQSSGFQTVLTGNVLTSSLINLTAGRKITFVIFQDGSGNRAFSWPSPISTYAICPQPNSVSIQQFQVLLDGATLIPVSPLLWVTASGIIVQPAGTPAVSVNTSGIVSNQYGQLLEQVDTTSGNITRTLFTAVGYQGFTLNFAKMDTSLNSINVVPTLGQTISGFPNFQISKAFNCLTIVSNGANWTIV